MNYFELLQLFLRLFVHVKFISNFATTKTYTKNIKMQVTITLITWGGIRVFLLTDAMHTAGRVHSAYVTKFYAYGRPLCTRPAGRMHRHTDSMHTAGFYSVYTIEGSLEVKGDGAAPGPEGGGPGRIFPFHTRSDDICIYSAAH